MDTRTGLLIIAYVAFGLFTFWVVARYFHDEGDSEASVVSLSLLWPLFWLVLSVSGVCTLLESIVARAIAFCRKDKRGQQ